MFRSSYCSLLLLFFFFFLCAYFVSNQIYFPPWFSLFIHYSFAHLYWQFTSQKLQLFSNELNDVSVRDDTGIIRCAHIYFQMYLCYISCRVTIPGIFWIRRGRRRRRKEKGEKKSIKHYNAPLISRQITMLRRTISISRDSRLGCLTVAEETYLHTSLVCSVLSRWFYSSDFFTSHLENGKFHEFQTASDETTDDSV